MRLFTKKAALRKLENVELHVSQSVFFLVLLLLVETGSHSQVGLELTM